jgi:hypothetical protein
MFRRTILLLAAAAASVAVASCAGSADDGLPSNTVFKAPPWDGNEVLTYNLEQEQTEGHATCELRTQVDGDRTTLVRSCAHEEGHRDDATVIVDSESLRPISSERTFYNAEDDESTVHRITYGPGEATFETESGGETRDTTRDLPQPTEDSPTPGWYDDDSILWLVRGIELREGFEDEYTHVINAGAPRVVSVELSVHELETVEVPAGEFRTWRVRVARDSVYTFWVEEAAPHRVIKAQVEDSTYELTGGG